MIDLFVTQRITLFVCNTLKIDKKNYICKTIETLTQL